MITTKDKQVLPDLESFKGIHLKKTIKDKCKVIGETTMYYSNAGSVQVLSPIPGSPSPDSDPCSDHIPLHRPKNASLTSFNNNGESHIFTNLYTWIFKLCTEFRKHFYR